MRFMQGTILKHGRVTADYFSGLGKAIGWLCMRLSGFGEYLANDKTYGIQEDQVKTESQGHRTKLSLAAY